MKSSDAAPPPLTPPSEQQSSQQAVRGPPFLVHKRIAVLGAHAVGKSALSIRCAQKRFEPNYMQTFQDIFQWNPVVNGVHYDVSIEDTDGQDANTEFAIRNTTGVDGYVLIFSVCDRYSFNVIKAVNEKLLDCLNVMERKGTAEVPRVLVGNQVDMAHERQVSSVEAETWAKETGIPYVETSAYTPYNADEAFETVLKLIKQNLDDSHTSPPPQVDLSVASPSSQPNQGCVVQ